MSPTFKRNAIAFLPAPALALPAATLYATGAHANKEQTVVAIRDQASLYHDTWSAEEMIGTDVRGENGDEIGEVKDIIVDRGGSVAEVVVEVGGFFRDRRPAHRRAVERRAHRSRHAVEPGAAARGPESHLLAARAHPAGRGRGGCAELLARARAHRRLRLKDVPRDGIVTDVIFDDQGKARAVIVDRADKIRLVELHERAAGERHGRAAKRMPDRSF
jgi:hypothetical protein